MGVTKSEAGRGHFNYADLLRTPDDGQRYEVLEGDLVVSPSPKVKHQRVARWLFELLVRAERGGCGYIYGAPMDLVLSDRSVLQPDLLFIVKDRLGIVSEANVQGAPDLVAEIISEGSRRLDAITERQIYERYGVRFCWLVDPEEETVRIFEFREGAYGEPAALRAGQPLTCPLFPDISQDVGTLFVQP